MNNISKHKIVEALSIFLNQNNKEVYELIPGMGCVVVSAPHSVEQTREGIIKHAEPMTGVLCKLLHEITSCPVIYKLRNDSDDANFDEVCGYKSSLIDFIIENNISFLLDIHQMSPSRDEMIDIGTGEGKNIYSRDDIVVQICKQFKMKDIVNVGVDEVFPATYQHTVSATISEVCRIPCFQIEINTKLLYEDYPEYNFNGVINALIHIIDYLRKNVE